MTLVTTARFTSAPNVSLSVGEIVDSAISDWTTPMTTIPVTGAPIRFIFLKKPGNMPWSAADLAVC